MDNKKGGMSDHDNEMAGRGLMALVFAVVAIIFLMVSPVLIGGFLIGLIWYGAYMEDGEPNGERLALPIVITLVTFTYLFGIPGLFTEYLGGVMFTDFGAWSAHKLWELIGAFNQILPRKFEIRNITVPELRLYAWSLMPAAVGAFVYLQFKGAGRGTFLYRGLWYLLMPLRMFCANFWWVAGLALVSSVASLIFHEPSWLRLGLGFVVLQLLVYSIIPLLKTKTELSSQVVKASGAGGTVVNDAPILVGHEKGKPHKAIKITEAQLNHHVHIVGASGFGKSVLLSHVIKNRIESGSGLMFVDLKADFETIRQVVSIAKLAGRLDDLAIFSCGNPEFSSPYNVLASGTANQLKDRIMGALNWSEEYYKNEAASFLLKLLKGLTLARDLRGTKFDLGTVLKCAEDPMAIAGINQALPESERETKIQLENLMAHLDKVENRKALQGLRSQLESLMLSDFGHLLKASDGGIDLFEAVSERKIVYVLLDSRTYGESSRALGKLILQDLKAASARIDNEIPRDGRVPFAVVVDEFADLATEDFIGFLDRARSSKIGVVVAHQEIADLSRISPEFARRLMNSASTMFSFLQKLPDSSELIGGITGTKKTKEVTEQAKSNWLFGDEKTGMKSIKEVDEFVIHPNTIRSLGVGECVMVAKYPTSHAAIVRVKAETTDGYLSDIEAKVLLSKLTPQSAEQGIQSRVIERRERFNSRTGQNQDAERF